MCPRARACALWGRGRHELEVTGGLALASVCSAVSQHCGSCRVGFWLVRVFWGGCRVRMLMPCRLFPVAHCPGSHQVAVAAEALFN